MSLNLNKEIDDVVAEPIKKPSPNWLLVSTVALSTILAVAVAAWAFGVISVGPASNIDAAADDVPTAETPAKRIKGNRRTKIYHLPRCSSYDRLAEHNIRWFNTRENALNAGYRLAGNC